MLLGYRHAIERHQLCERHVIIKRPLARWIQSQPGECCDTVFKLSNNNLPVCPLPGNGLHYL